ncbi:MAG: TetR family transcriptional regulator [Streptosporangiales bacterium]|nr:TetR family transcriptional regulator [Streptosporangiales bacterium]
MTNKAGGTSRRDSESSRPSLRGGTPAQTRELRSQGRETMRRLLDAGRAVFEQRGFHSARVDDIVAMARTSHGTFYLYFANKEDLFKALARDAMTEMGDLADELPILEAGEAGRRSVRAWVARFCDLYETHAIVLRILSDSDVVGSELWSEGEKALSRLTETIHQRTEQARRAGSINPAVNVTLTATACLLMLERFNTFLRSGMLELSRDEVVDTLAPIVYAAFFSVEPA